MLSRQQPLLPASRTSSPWLSCRESGLLVNSVDQIRLMRQMQDSGAYFSKAEHAPAPPARPPAGSATGRPAWERPCQKCVISILGMGIAL